MALAAFEGNQYPFGETVLAAFETNSYSRCGTALAVFEVLKFTLVGARHWRRFRLTHTLVATKKMASPTGNRLDNFDTGACGPQ